MTPTLQQGDPSFEQAPIQVDARGLRCPLPVIRLAEVARDAPAGTRILVLASDPAARYDIPAWCRMRHHELLELTEFPGPVGDTGRDADSGHADSGHADSAHADSAHADGGHADGGHADGGHADSGHADSAPKAGAPPAYLRFVVRLLAQPASAGGSDSGRERSSRSM